MAEHHKTAALVLGEYRPKSSRGRQEKRDGNTYFRCLKQPSCMLDHANRVAAHRARRSDAQISVRRALQPNRLFNPALTRNRQATTKWLVLRSCITENLKLKNASQYLTFATVKQFQKNFLNKCQQNIFRKMHSSTNRTCLCHITLASPSLFTHSPT